MGNFLIAFKFFCNYLEKLVHNELINLLCSEFDLIFERSVMHKFYIFNTINVRQSKRKTKKTKPIGGLIVHRLFHWSHLLFMGFFKKLLITND